MLILVILCVILNYGLAFTNMVRYRRVFESLNGVICTTVDLETVRIEMEREMRSTALLIVLLLALGIIELFMSQSIDSLFKGIFIFSILTSPVLFIYPTYENLLKRFTFENISHEDIFNSYKRQRHMFKLRIDKIESKK